MEQRAGSIMDKKAQGSGSGKALGIGELLASACSAIKCSAGLITRRRKARGAVTNVQIIELAMPSRCC